MGLLRCIGLFNAAIWFGAGIHFAFFGGTAPFSNDMRDLLGANNYPYFSGAIAQILIARYLRLQIICACVAIIHLFAERLYYGRLPQARWVGVSLMALFLTMAGRYWLLPKMRDLHRIKYAVNITSQAHEAAAHSFLWLHSMSQIINLFLLISLGFYLWRMANPKETMQFVGTPRFGS
jgi:hypothetical protein